MLKSELLEREAEARRAQLAQTFDELRARVTPGHVLDRLVDYATDSGGADFFRNLREQTVANPLALGIVGAGLAWLMLSNGRPGRSTPGTSYRGRMRTTFAGARERTGNALGEARDRVAEAAYRASEAAGSIGATARTARDAAFETASQWRDAAGSAAASLRDTTYEQARSRASETRAALGGAASTVYGGVAQSAGWTAEGMKAFATGAATTSRDMFDFCRDQPLVLAGLGVALGAAVGAAFPSTETESELMGEASDDLKERTRAFAQEQYEKSRSTAEAALDKVHQKVQESSRSLMSHPSIVPSGAEGEIGQTQEPVRPERIGLRDGQN
jgi:Protein of unknown function (DUF3618)